MSIGLDDSHINGRSSEKKTYFISYLLTWHEKNNRNYLYWRNTKNAYHILISEIMLQKTTVKQVEDLIKKFILKYPSPKELSESNVEIISNDIKTLGMEHIRAKRLFEIAKILQNKREGNVPDNRKDLLELPGVGNYIANSVLYLAFDEQLPIVDTNIVRIIERVFSFVSDKKRPRTDNKMWDFIDGITPSGRSRDVNIALLDFGALVCTSRNPKHQNCPVSQICSHYKKETKISE